MCSLTAIAAPALCSCFAGRHFVPPLPHLALLRSIGVLSQPKWQIRGEKTGERNHRFDIGGWGEGIPITQTGILPAGRVAGKQESQRQQLQGRNVTEPTVLPWTLSVVPEGRSLSWQQGLRSFILFNKTDNSREETLQWPQGKWKEQFSCQWVEKKVPKGQMVWNSSVCQRTALNLWTTHISLQGCFFTGKQTNRSPISGYRVPPYHCPQCFPQPEHNLQGKGRKRCHFCHLAFSMRGSEALVN